MTTAQQVLSLAASHIGWREGPNNENPWTARYGLPNQPYCCAFCSCMLEDCGIGFMHGVCYCPTGVAKFRSAGALFATPQVGDVGFIYHNSLGRYAHAVFVKAVDGDWFWTIEANSNNTGGREGIGVFSLKRLWKGTKTVFGRPAYEPSAPVVVPAGHPPTIRRGSTGHAVVLLQDQLNNVMYPQPRYVVKIDGDFGPATEAVVKEFQRIHGLEVDGVVGPMTWTALQR